MSVRKLSRLRYLHRNKHVLSRKSERSQTLNFPLRLLLKFKRVCKLISFLQFCVWYGTPFWSLPKNGLATFDSLHILPACVYPLFFHFASHFQTIVVRLLLPGVAEGGVYPFPVASHRRRGSGTCFFFYSFELT